MFREVHRFLVESVPDACLHELWEFQQLGQLVLVFMNEGDACARGLSRRSSFGECPACLFERGSSFNEGVKACAEIVECGMHGCRGFVGEGKGGVFAIAQVCELGLDRGAFRRDEGGFVEEVVEGEGDEVVEVGGGRGGVVEALAEEVYEQWPYRSVLIDPVNVPSPSTIVPRTCNRFGRGRAVLWQESKAAS